MGIFFRPSAAKILGIEPNQVDVVRPTPVAPPKVEGLSATPGNSVALLKWLPVVPIQPLGKQIQKYRISYGTNQGQMDQSQETTDANSTWELKNLINETQYFVNIKAVDSDGLESLEPSTIITVTPVAPSVTITPELPIRKGNGLDIMKELVYESKNKKRQHAFLVLNMLFYVYQMEKMHPYFKNENGHKLVNHFGMDESNVESILKAVFGTKRYSGDLKRDIEGSLFDPMVYDKVLQLDKTATAESISPLIDGLSDTVYKFNEMLEASGPQKLENTLSAISEIKEKEEEANGLIGAEEIVKLLKSHGIELPLKKTEGDVYKLDIRLFDESLAQSMILENENRLRAIRGETPPATSANKAPEAGSQKVTPEKYNEAVKRLEGIIARLESGTAEEALNLSIKINEIPASKGIGIGMALFVIARDKKEKGGWKNTIAEHCGVNTDEDSAKKIVEIDQQLEANGIYAP